MEIFTETIIDASLEKVWELLADYPRYSEWNPFVRSIEGAPVVGQRIRIFVQPPGTRGIRITPIVHTVVPQREIRWRGRFLLPGLLDAERVFQIEPLSGGKTRFVHRESIHGLLTPLFYPLERKTREGFVAMNEALKLLSEA